MEMDEVTKEKIGAMVLFAAIADLVLMVIFYYMITNQNFADSFIGYLVLSPIAFLIVILTGVVYLWIKHKPL